MKKQVFNPFLPPGVCIPDGEPHLFEGRVYLYGSHDREGGWTFCMDDYEVWSAPEDDLSDWRLEGTIYKASQDPMYPDMKYMYAPDVVRGNDGRYYLYYCMSGDYGVGGYRCPISVAVSDTPAGKYEYLGHVQNPDGSLMMRYVCFDPAVLNDNGVIRLYYGTQYGFEEDHPGEEWVLKTEMDMFGRTKEEILSYPDSINGPVTAVLEDDMLTVKEPAKHIIPYKVRGTSFEEHPFFEASSMRKVGEKYYFVYSSWQNHELCYATSDFPDRDFTFGGTIVSNGDVGIGGRKIDDKLNMTGTTHGSIIEVKGQWYVFYHRLTHKSDYSRQACAEKIRIAPDGSIEQVEITSCGLNNGPLLAEGSYPAGICCNLTNGRMPHGCNSVYPIAFPNVTHRVMQGAAEAAAGKTAETTERFIGEIEDGTLIGYKYFECKDLSEIGITVRYETPENLVTFDGPARIDERSAEELKKFEKPKTEAASEADDSEEGYFDISTSMDGPAIARIAVPVSSDSQAAGSAVAADPDKWLDCSGIISPDSLSDGTYAFFFRYHGKRKVQLKEIRFN